MSLVLDVSRMLAVTADLDPLLRRIAEAVTALLDCERASIFLHDPATDELWTKVALLSAQIRIGAGAGIVGHAFRNNRPLHVPRPYDDSRFNREPDRHSGFVTRNLLAVPMVYIDQKPVGVIQAINKANGDFSETDLAMLQLLADQAGVAVQRYHLQQAAVRTTALVREMELARTVQQAMIPTRPPGVPGLEAAGWTRPASINGGDVFDLWKLPDGRLGVLLADASGHGIGPALVVSQVRALVRVLSETEPDPCKLLARVNARLYQDLTGGRFVTAFLGYLAPDGLLHWCSSGHGPSLARTGHGSNLHTLDATLPPLGVLEELPIELAPAPLQLDPQGALIVLSDGITEATNPAGELFGVERLVNSVQRHPDPRPADAIATLRSDVYRWQEKEEPVDDQTIVVVRRAG